MALMNVITIPKNIAKQGDLVILSRKEYEALLGGKSKKIKEVQLTSVQEKALVEMRKEVKKGKSLSFNGLQKEVGLTR